MNLLPKLFRGLATAVVAVFAASMAAAQASYPSKPIKIVVPFTPGGTCDNVARILAAGLTEKLGQPVIVENKPGSGTIMGTGWVAKSEPDGYTLLVTTTPLAINESLYKTLPYKLSQDLVPVNVLASIPLVMIVNPTSKAQSVADLVQMAKTSPGKLSFGSSGVGGSPHLSMELFQSMTGTKMVHVPYKGSAPAVMDLVAGNTDVVVDTLFLTKPQVVAGKARALAQLGATRSRLMPDVPTLQESGLKGFDVSSWFMLVAPAATPAAIVDKLNVVSNEIIASGAVQATFAKQGLEAVGGKPAEAQGFLRTQIERFGTAVKSADVKPE